MTGPEPSQWNTARRQPSRAARLALPSGGSQPFPQHTTLVLLTARSCPYGRTRSSTRHRRERKSRTARRQPCPPGLRPSAQRPGACCPWPRGSEPRSQGEAAKSRARRSETTAPPVVRVRASVRITEAPTYTARQPSGHCRMVMPSRARACRPAPRRRSSPAGDQPGSRRSPGRSPRGRTRSRVVAGGRRWRAATAARRAVPADPRVRLLPPSGCGCSTKA